MTGFFLAISLFIQIHSWYDYECCHDNDCKPVPCEQIEETKQGFKYDGLFFSKIKPSKDNQCHACILKYDGGRTPMCLYLQMGV
jgi:hypothetical protein